MDWLQLRTQAMEEVRSLQQFIAFADSHIARGGGKRRGRPPAWMAALSATDAPEPDEVSGGKHAIKKKRKGWSPERRAAFKAKRKANA